MSRVSRTISLQWWRFAKSSYLWSSRPGNLAVSLWIPPGLHELQLHVALQLFHVELRLVHGASHHVPLLVGQFDVALHATVDLRVLVRSQGLRVNDHVIDLEVLGEYLPQLISSQVWQYVCNSEARDSHRSEAQ